MKSHYFIGYMLILALPMIIAAIAYRRVKTVASVVAAVAVSFFVLISSLALTAFSVVECADSIDIRIAAPKLLTPSELESLEDGCCICPTVFHFQRAGKLQCLVSDHDGGAFIGCG